MDELQNFFELLFVGIVILISMITSARKAKTKRIADAAKQSRAREQETYESAPAWQPAAPSSSFPDRSSPVIAPTVHPHLEPDCAPHDAPGSLGVSTLEGKDPCHEAQLTHPRTADDSAPETSGLTFDWSGDNMVKAFVMQEVLTRPCQRQAR